MKPHFTITLSTFVGICFSFGHKYPLKNNAKPQPAASCNDCHDGNADDDWVFTQYYPVLRAANN